MRWIHKILRIRAIQLYLGYKRPSSLSSEILKYVGLRSERSISIELKHKFSSRVKADLVLKIDDKFIMVECKQGSPEH